MMGLFVNLLLCILYIFGAYAQGIHTFLLAQRANRLKPLVPPIYYLNEYFAHQL